jgi:predicted metal-dependent hydrolase
MSTVASYLGGYPPSIIEQVEQLIAAKNLTAWLAQKYPEQHEINNDKALYQYVMALKGQYMKSAPPISKVVYAGKARVALNALGMHTRIARVQGGKLKGKNEIRIASIFKQAPRSLLELITVHELAHLKEREHDKAFYQLCNYMLPGYHQRELDLRLWLIDQELSPKS